MEATVIKHSDRIYIGGRTRMGKTELCKKIVSTLPRIIVFDPSWEYGKLGAVTHDLAGLTKNKSPKIIFQPMQPHDIDAFDRFCKAVFQAANVTVVIDEIHLFTGPHTIPPNLKNLIVLGAKKGIGVFMISQRPALTNTTCISQANHIICFSLFLERDLEFFRGFLGSHADHIGSLPQYSYLHYDIREGSIVVRDGNGKTVLSVLRQA